MVMKKIGIGWILNMKIKLTLKERKKLLHEFHWPKILFPNKIYKGYGTERECNYYNIPKYREA